MAQIDVDLAVDPKAAQPDELILVAPLGFNFTQNCLVASRRAQTARKERVEAAVQYISQVM